MYQIKNMFVRIHCFSASNPRVVAVFLSALVTTALALIGGPVDAQMLAWGPATGGTGGV